MRILILRPVDGVWANGRRQVTAGRHRLREEVAGGTISTDDAGIVRRLNRQKRCWSRELNQEKQKLDLEGDLWRFALAFYGRPGIAETCLRLQDEAGIDVIALIVVLYADTVLTRGLDERDIAGLQASMRRWRDGTVLPLRRLRRALKQPPPEFPAEETEALRGLIKKAELRAEQIQLALAEQWLSKRLPQPGIELERALARLASVPVGNDEIAGMFARTIVEARATVRG